MNSPARRLLDDRLAGLADDLDALFANSQERTRRECAEQLNQAVRLMRIASDAGELFATLENAAAQFAEGAMLFRVEDDAASHERIRIQLDSAAAFAAAVEYGEPQTAAATPSEVSAALVELLGHEPADRVSVFPVEAGDRVEALVYAWGDMQGAAIELLAQVAGTLNPRPLAPPLELVTIAPAPASPVAEPKPSWESLSPEEQRIHLSAQRSARVQVAEMRLYEPDAVQSGRTLHDLYNALRKPIDAARESFRERFFSRCPSMVDYLHLELLRVLANDDPELLGKDYPGPLV